MGLSWVKGLAVVALVSAGAVQAADARAADQPLPQDRAPKDSAQLPSGDSGQTPPKDKPQDVAECVSDEANFKQKGGVATFVVDVKNSCDKRVKCVVSAYLITATGAAQGQTTLILAPQSEGAGSEQSFVMDIKSAGGMANVSRQCEVF